MRIAKAKIGILAGCVVVMAAVQVLAEDWPQYIDPNI